MKGPVAVLCSRASAAGMALAGVRATVVDDPATLGAALDELLAAGPSRPLVLLVEAELHARIPARWQRRMARDPALLVVPFPSAQAAAGAAPDAYLLELLRHAIGYRVRLA